MVTLAAALREKGLAGASLAVDETGVPPSLWQAIQGALPGARITDGSGILRYARMVKTPGEVERLAHAARVNEEAFDVAAKAMRLWERRTIEEPEQWYQWRKWSDMKAEA